MIEGAEKLRGMTGSTSLQGRRAAEDLSLHARDVHIFERLLTGVVVIFAVWGASVYSGGDTANSRLATVVSLHKHGTWYIDRPLDEAPIRFEQRTIDKVVVNGRLLSSKPPILPLLMTGEYLLLNKAFGWDLEDEYDRNRIVRFMTVTLIGFAYVAAVVFFAKILRMFVADPLTRIMLLFCLAFCTQLWGYSHNINNHVPAAGMLVVALYFALGVGSGKLAPRPWRFFAFGLAGGLAITLDMPAAIFVFLAGLYLLAKHPARTLTWAVLGAAIPIGTHCAIMISVTGSPLPVQMRKELYLSEASYWRSPRGIDALNESKWTYFFHITFGRCGLFSLYPILFAGLMASLRALVSKKVPNRGYILAGALGFCILTAYYVLRTNNYGGEAYGFRWYIVAMPVLLLMAPPIISNLRIRWKWYFMAVMIGISFYSAWECSCRPWGANHEWTCRFLGPSYGPMPQRPLK